MKKKKILTEQEKREKEYLVTMRRRRAIRKYEREQELLAMPLWKRKETKDLERKMKSVFKYFLS